MKNKLWKHVAWVLISLPFSVFVGFLLFYAWISLSQIERMAFIFMFFSVSPVIVGLCILCAHEISTRQKDKP